MTLPTQAEFRIVPPLEGLGMLKRRITNTVTGSDEPQSPMLHWADAQDRPRRRRNSEAGLPQRLSLALQGGGSFGAFTWGVLDRLLQEQTSLGAVSGASAGAINAVLLASGLAEGGPEEARAKLERFWRRVSFAAPPRAALEVAVELAQHNVSPYVLNPLGINPLRDLLGAEVDFDRLRSERPIPLLIAATRVSDGRLRLFREDEVTMEAVLASCCLPRLHHAVEIGGEAYWDGGFSANPPLRQLAIETTAEDILLVQLMPEQALGTPKDGREIAAGLTRLAFAEPLLKELEGLQDLRRLSRTQVTAPSGLCRKISRLKLHRIAAEDAVPELGHLSPLETDWPFLGRLHEAGSGAAGSWLAGLQREELPLFAAA
jgi:NTE family protein